MNSGGFGKLSDQLVLGKEDGVNGQILFWGAKEGRMTRGASECGNRAESAILAG